MLISMCKSNHPLKSLFFSLSLDSVLFTLSFFLFILLQFYLLYSCTLMSFLFEYMIISILNSIPPFKSQSCVTFSLAKYPFPLEEIELEGEVESLIILFSLQNAYYYSFSLYDYLVVVPWSFLLLVVCCLLPLCLQVVNPHHMKRKYLKSSKFFILFKRFRLKLSIKWLI